MNGDNDLKQRRRQKVAEEDHPSASLRGRTEAVQTLVDEPDLGLFEWEYPPQRCRIGVDQAPPEESERHTEVWVTVAGDADRLEEAVRAASVRLRWESGPREGRAVPEPSVRFPEGPGLG